MLDSDCGLWILQNKVNKSKKSLYNSMDMEAEYKIKSQNLKKYEKFRIESFLFWPVPWLDCRELAENGFYYTGSSDHICCAFCNLTLGNFEAEDDISAEHMKWSPNCKKDDNIRLDTQYPNIKKKSIELIMKQLMILKEDEELIRKFDNWYVKEIKGGEEEAETEDYF